MVVITLVDGRKGPNDVLVKVASYDEVLTFAQWLYIGKWYLDSEASYYPVSEGFIGKAMLMNAINEISQDVPFDKVLKHYKLTKKGLIIKDERKRIKVLGENRGVNIEINHNSPYFRKSRTKRELNVK